MKNECDKNADPASVFTLLFSLYCVCVLCSCRTVEGWWVFVWLWVCPVVILSPNPLSPCRAGISFIKTNNKSCPLTNPDEMILLVCEQCLTLPKMHLSVLNGMSVLCLKRIYRVHANLENQVKSGFQTWKIKDFFYNIYLWLIKI